MNHQKFLVKRFSETIGCTVFCPHTIDEKTHGLSQKIQGTYFEISALYFKIYGLYFSPFQISDKQ